MSTQVQYRRGTAGQNNSFVGALAEITVDTTNLTLRVHDGINAGGSNIATVAFVDNAIGSLSANSITDGTSSVTIISANGNIRANVGGSTVQLLSSGGANVTGFVTATGNITGGNLSGTSIVGTLTTAAQTNITSVGTLTSLAVTGNITGGNLSGTSIVGTLTTAAQTNITSVGTLTALTVTGNVTGGNLITAGLVSLSSITKTGANGVGNIGAAASTFNTIFARATSALYADLAELYTADSAHAPGTVLVFGGPAEVAESTQSHSTRIAGIVSTNPAHVMNSALTAAHTAVVALVGRAPCRVVGIIQPGDCLVSSDIPGTATVLDAARYQPGCVIGKALAPYNSTEPGTIEVVVGRL